jgi:flagellar hook-basal body complex protein FliE
MSNMEINKVIAQMRALQTQMEPVFPALPTTTQAGGSSFSQLLGNAVNQVNDQSMKAQSLVKAYETGSSTTSVAEVMIEMQKSSLGFEAMTQVRNRLVDAYKEIMNMPI